MDTLRAYCFIVLINLFPFDPPAVNYWLFAQSVFYSITSIVLSFLNLKPPGSIGLVVLISRILIKLTNSYRIIVKSIAPFFYWVLITLTIPFAGYDES